MSQPKFNLAEIIIWGMVAFLIDVISFFADFLGGVGGFFVQALTWFLFTLVFYLKGATASASLTRRFIIPIAVQILPFIPTQLATLLVSIYMENHPEKFGLVTTAATLSKMDTKKLRSIKDTKGTFTAAREARTMYKDAKKDTAREFSEPEYRKAA